mgnify:CR=1 FL=1
MTITIQPVIKGYKVEGFSLSFDDPLPLQDFERLWRKFYNELQHRMVKTPHKHNFIQYPVYSGGEMIAVVKKCSCGATIRTNV